MSVSAVCGQVRFQQQCSLVWSVIRLMPAFRFEQDYGNSYKVPKCILSVQMWCFHCTENDGLVTSGGTFIVPYYSAHTKYKQLFKRALC